MLSRELEHCRTQLTAITAELGKSKEASTGKVPLYPGNVIMCRSCVYEKTLRYYTMAGSLARMEEKLKDA